MGYHIIIKAEKGDLVSHYAEKYEDLAEFSDIQSDSIIYEGEPNWKPIIVGEDKKYKNLADPKFRAGMKAEKLFREQAIKHGLMLEKLSQDYDSFKAYKSGADVPIKRGDYLVRNAGNMEIEIKCFTFYKIDNKECFYIDYHTFKKHQNMESFTKCPVVFVIYHRDGDSPVKDSLCMIALDIICQENNKAISWDDKLKCFIVPISLTTKGFELIDKERAKIQEPEKDKVD
jgi:hypothetical protein